MVTATSIDALRSRLLSSRFLADALAACACLTATFLNFLNYNHYPAVRIETGICVSILLAIAVLFGFASARLRRRERTLFAALFLAVVVQMSVGGGALLVAAVATAAILLKNRALPFAGVTFFVVLLFQSAQALLPPPVTATAAPRAERKDLPVIVHVLLDGAIGIEGMPDDVPEARRAAAWGRDWLIGKGFAVYGRAYSEHMYTVDSVPHILGLESEHDVQRNHYHYKLRSSRYLAALDKWGYAITVYQNTAASYCENLRVDACWTARGYLQLAQSPLPASQKAVLLLRSLASLSPPIDFSAQLYDIAIAAIPRLASAVPPLNWEDVRFPTALGGMQAFDELIDRAARARPGEAHFAHLLLPHGPYSLDADCRIKPRHDWVGPRSHFRSRREIYRAYAEQWRCALRRVGELMDALWAARPKGDFIVFVHGDHGSRIDQLGRASRSAGALSPQDFRDGYSTLAAIRLPDGVAGYFRDLVPVRSILEALVAENFEAPLPLDATERATIFLDHPPNLAPAPRVTVPGMFEDE